MGSSVFDFAHMDDAAQRVGWANGHGISANPQRLKRPQPAKWKSKMSRNPGFKQKTEESNGIKGVWKHFW